MHTINWKSINSALYRSGFSKNQLKTIRSVIRAKLPGYLEFFLTELKIQDLVTVRGSAAASMMLHRNMVMQLDSHSLRALTCKEDNLFLNGLLTIAHESVHAKQMVDGRLKQEHDLIYWEGVPICTNSSLKTLTDDEYNNQEWEKHANITGIALARKKLAKDGELTLSRNALLERWLAAAKNPMKFPDVFRSMHTTWFAGSPGA